MSASNFHRGNTSKVFAVLMDREETFKECPECGEIHNKYTYSEEDFNNLVCCEVDLVEQTETARYFRQTFKRAVTRFISIKINR